VPQEIHFVNAILVAVTGLLVNFLCAWILGGSGGGPRETPEEKTKVQPDPKSGILPHHETDQNHRAAFLHVMADALTSVFAIGALIFGMSFDMVWPDALAGLLGGTLILSWAYGLVRQTAGILLDGDVEPDIVKKIRETIENDADNKVIDLHVWRIGENDLAVIAALLTQNPQPPEYYRSLLQHFSDLRHVSIEIHTAGDVKDGDKLK
jgi:cation diffusion facilitator family transporter